jgi:hypothetical protein
VLEVQLASRIHDLLEQDGEPVLLQPLWQKIFASEGKLVYISLEEHVVDGDGRLAIGSHPFIRDDMNEKSSTPTGNGIVFDDFDAHGRFAVNSQE